jgi:hypothetical protein
MNYSKIPESTLDGLKRYVEDRIPPGDFLRAVLEDKLVESFGRADEFNRSAMFDICAYIYNEIPSLCHGSPEKVEKWLRGVEEL